MNTRDKIVVAIVMMSLGFAGILTASCSAEAISESTYNIALEVSDTAEITCGLDIDVLFTGPDSAVVTCGKGVYSAAKSVSDELVYVVDLNAEESAAVTCSAPGVLNLTWGIQRVTLACEF